MKEKTGKNGIPPSINDPARRIVMRKIVIGVGFLAGSLVLPETWTRPIIGQIVLPAHAATSGSTLHDPCMVGLRSGTPQSATVTVRVTGFVTPPATDLPVKITATAVGGAGQKIDATTKTNAQGTFEAFITIGGGPGITSVNVVTTVQGAAGSAKCSASVASACSGNGTVVAGSSASIVVVQPYPSAYDLYLIVNGITIGVVDGDLLSQSFDNVTINLGANTIRFEYVGLTGVDIFRFFHVTSGSLTYEQIPAAINTTYTVCGV